MMKKIFTIFSMLLLIHFNKAQAQFGDGSAGTVTLTGVFTPTKTALTSLALDISGSGATIGLQSTVGFAVGDQLLIYQQTGVVATSNAGNFNRVRITSLNTATGEAFVVLEQPYPFYFRNYDIGTEEVMVFKLEQYDNISIVGTLTPSAGQYIIPLLAKTSIVLTNGVIDVSAHGTYAGDNGLGGIPSVLTSTAGLAGGYTLNNGGIGGNGGSSGTGGTGMYGGGNGGALGKTGGSAIAPNYTPYRFSNSTTVAKNASIPAAKRYVSGEGGMESYGSDAANEGAAGGGGSINPNTGGVPTNGYIGTQGAAGNAGGIGSAGAGIVFLFTTEVAGLADSTNIKIKATNASAGGNGANGGNGGNGGLGGGRDCNQVGGGGGGGNGADGSIGAAGGNAGAGGAVYAYRMASAPSGYPVLPISAYVNNGSALGGAGGAGGAGGSAGAFGGDANIDPLTLCIPIAPCATDTELQKTILHVSSLYLGPPYTSQDQIDHYIYHLNIGLPTEKITITQFWWFYGTVHTIEIFIDSFHTFLDCNGNSYKSCIVHNVYENTTGLPFTRDTVNYKLYTTNGTAAELTNYFINIDTLSRIVYTAGPYIDNGFILTPAGTVWMLDCYSNLCNPTPALPGNPGLPGIAGLDGEPGVIDEDFFTGTPLSIAQITLKGAIQNNTNVITWATHQKENTNYYEVLKSFDGLHFTTIQKIENENIADNEKNNIINDEEKNNDDTYYQVSQIMKDNSVQKSNIVKLKNGTVGGGLIVYPNPIKNNATITIESAKACTSAIKIYNRIGALIVTIPVNLSKGNNSFDINMSNYASGEYAMQSFINNTNYTTKFTKE